MNYKITNYVKKYTKHLILILFLIVITTYCDLMLPDYMAKIIDNGISNKDINYIYKIGINMIGIAVIGMFTNLIVSYISSILSNKISNNIRKDLYNKIIDLDNKDNLSSSSLINILTIDVNQVNSGIFMILRIIIMAPIIAIFGIIKVLNTNLKMSLIILISVIIMLILILIMFKYVFPKIKILKQLLDKLNLITKENINGIKTIKSFNKEKYQFNKFKTINDKILDTNYFINKIMLLLTPSVTLIVNITTIVIIYIGINEIAASNLKIGVLLAYIEYMMQIMTAFLMASLLFIIVPKMSISNKRIKEIMNMENKIIDTGKLKLNTDNINIEFRNVNFSYNNNRKILENINFKINNNEKIGIIGTFSSGKTTLIKLICRLIEKDNGQILINDVDIDQYTIKSLRKKISISWQDDVILEGTIKSNIKYYNKKLSSDRLKKIYGVSKLNKFVKYNEINKYKVSSNGKNLSGGQKKRLNIAKCLAKDASIYIFDDSLSEIDYKTSSEIIKNIINHLKEKTLILITQRISNIKNFDKIIVMNNGKIECIGNHDYLLNNSKTYIQIYESQIWK